MNSEDATSRGPAYSIWLLPAEPTASALARLVTELAMIFATPSFLPHVTVQVGLQRPLREVSRMVAALAADISAAQWAVTSVEASDEYFRSFYLALATGPAFDAMTERAAGLSGTRAGLPPFPHLSLAYGPLDPARKDALRQTLIARLPTVLAFDRIAVALAGSSVGVPSWRTLQAFALAS